MQIPTEFSTSRAKLMAARGKKAGQLSRGLIDATIETGRAKSQRNPAPPSALSHPVPAPIHCQVSEVELHKSTAVRLLPLAASPKQAWQALSLLS